MSHSRLTREWGTQVCVGPPGLIAAKPGSRLCSKVELQLPFAFDKSGLLDFLMGTTAGAQPLFKLGGVGEDTSAARDPVSR